MPRTSAALLLALALASVSAPAWAERGTEAEQEACTPDVFRLCGDFIPNEAPILACLQAKHAQLSPACEPVIFPHTADAPAAPDAAAKPAKPHKRHRHRHHTAT